MAKVFDLEVKSRPATKHQHGLWCVNLVARKHLDVVSGGFWESGRLYGSDEKGEKRKQREGKQG